MKIPYFLLLALALVSACGRNDKDNVILQESRMVDVLYDYQMALALAAESSTGDDQAELEYKYVEALYTKHLITREQFDLSLAHYARDPKLLIAITEKVSKRLSEDLNNGQVQTSDARGNINGLLENDTVTYFSLDKGCILSTNEFNRRTFSIPSGKIRGVGSVQLSFDSKFLYREGGKNVVVVTTLKCCGDSTIRRTQNVHDYEPHHCISVDIPRNKKVETLKFDVYQSAVWQKYPQIFLMYNVKLQGLNIHE